MTPPPPPAPREEQGRCDDCGKAEGHGPLCPTAALMVNDYEALWRADSARLERLERAARVALKIIETRGLLGFGALKAAIRPAPPSPEPRPCPDGIAMCTEHEFPEPTRHECCPCASRLREQLEKASEALALAARANQERS